MQRTQSAKTVAVAEIQGWSSSGLVVWNLDPETRSRRKCCRQPLFALCRACSDWIKRTYARTDSILPRHFFSHSSVQIVSIEPTRSHRYASSRQHTLSFEPTVRRWSQIIDTMASPKASASQARTKTLLRSHSLSEKMLPLADPPNGRLISTFL